MASHFPLHYPARSALPRWVMVGAVSGAVSVLLFHQGAAALLHAAGLTALASYAIPLWLLVFCGAVWGAVLAASLGRLEGVPLMLAAAFFGAILPTLVAWFIVGPSIGQWMTPGGAPTATGIGVLLNAAWGLGTGIGLALFGRKG